MLVDGHAPGAIPVDIRALGVDWWRQPPQVGARAAQLRLFVGGAGAAGHPACAGRLLGSRPGFLHEFEHTPTTNPTSLLAAPDGIALQREWNFDACVDYMHRLALDAATLLTETWGTSVRGADLDGRRDGHGAAAARTGQRGCRGDARAVLALLVEDRIEVQLHAAYGRLWIRVSAQVYNDRADLQRLGDAVAKRCAAHQTV